MLTRIPDWRLTHLYRSILLPDRLILSERRDNISSNPQRMAMHPAGDWVCVPGGGGYRSPVDAKEQGYKVLVFSALGFERPHQICNVGAYPRGAAFNPVTDQFAGVREKGIKIFNLATKDPPAELKGSFLGPVTWSSDGVYLLAAGKEGGVKVFKNTLSEDERVLARMWWKRLRPSPTLLSSMKSRPATRPVARAKAIPALQRFAPGSNLGQLRVLLKKVTASRRTAAPSRWQSCPAYASLSYAKKIGELEAEMKKGGDTGVQIFTLKTILKKEPSAPAKCALASLYLKQERVNSAMKLLQEAVREDAGRSEVSPRALHTLGTEYDRKNEGLKAIECFAWAYYLDSQAPTLKQRLAAVLRKNNMSTEIALLNK